MYKGSPFSTFSPTFVVSCLFDIAFLTTVRWEITVVLICISIMIHGFHDVERLFMCLLVPICFYLEKCLFICPAHFLNQIFFAIELYEFFLYFGYLSSIRYMVWKYFSFHSLSFQFVDCLFCCADYLLYSCLFILCFVACTLNVIYKKSLSRPMSRIFLPMFSSWS